MKRALEMLPYLWAAWAVVTVVLTAMAIRDDHFYFRAAEAGTTGSKRRLLIARLHDFDHVLINTSILWVILFATCLFLWAWMAFVR